MATVREVLYQHTKKFSARAIARSFGMSKTTVRKYLKLATTHGYSAKINDLDFGQIPSIFRHKIRPNKRNLH